MMHQPDDAPANVFQQISELGREFGKLLTAGKAPRIETYLSQVTEEGQEILFGNLLGIEVNYRRSQGESPKSAEYLHRFPQFQRQVRRTFFEPSLNSVDLNVSTAGEQTTSVHGPERENDSLPPTCELPATNRLGDYELIRMVGRGGMGIVYEGRHAKTNNRVALKTLPTSGDGQHVNADRLYRFRKEFRRLAEINHPNLVGMQSLEVDGDRWFFTMDLVDGEDFLSFVRPHDELDESRLRLCLKQLAVGVIELHQNGIIHRDLKPSNVLVSHDGTVTILDFGLAAELHRATDMTQTKSGVFAGTPQYAAPEQMFGDRTEASDWYAFGTMLYEALTGHPPFQGKDQLAVLRQKQEQEPPSLANREDVPTALATLADGLLCREPSSRLTQGAIIERLGLHHETRTAGSTRDSKGSTDSLDQDSVESGEDDGEPFALIGREQQLAELETIKREYLDQRQTQVVWITGLSGEGKSSLVEKFLEPLRKDRDILVLSGRCYDRESVPFKAVDCWMDSLVSYFLRNKGKLDQVIPDDTVALAQLFPVLKRVPAVQELPPLNDPLMTSERLRRLAFQALKGLLLEISRTSPVILFVDDLQWGDEDSLAAFQQLLQVPSSPGILFVGCYRRDECEQSPFLQAWKQHNWRTNERTLEVGPLSEVESIELARQLIPNAGQTLVEQVSRLYLESGGNPYFLQRLIDDFDFETQSFRSQPVSQIIEQSLSRLPESARALIEFLVVIGRSVRVEELAYITDSSENIYQVLTRMRNEKLVRMIGSGDDAKVDTYHDKVRETIHANISDTVRRRLHREIALRLESMDAIIGFSCESHAPFDEWGDELGLTGIPHLFDLAHHHLEAGTLHAIHYQLVAGEESLRLYSNQESVRYFESALKLVTPETPATLRCRVFEGLGTALVRTRQQSIAFKYLDDAETLASAAVQKARLLFIKGNAFSANGQTEQAIKSWDSALQGLGRPRPQSTMRKAASLFGKILAIWWYPPERALQKFKRDPLAHLELRINSRIIFDLMEKEPFFFLERGLAASVAGLHSQDARVIASGQSDASLWLHMIGLSRLATRCAHAYEKADRSMLTGEMISNGDFKIAMSSYMSGDIHRAEARLRNSVAVGMRAGDTRTTVFAWHMLRHACGYISPASEEQLAAEESFQAAQELGDQKAVCWGFYDQAEALARRGKLCDAFKMLQASACQLGEERWLCTETIFESVAGICFRQASQHNHGVTLLTETIRDILAKKLFFEYTARAFPVFIECMLGPRWLERPTAAMNSKLKRNLRWLHVVDRLIPLLRISNLRVRGRYAASQARHRKAIRLFERTIRNANEVGMPYLEALAMLDLAAVCETDRDETRAKAIELLNEMESVIPRAESWLLGDQYDESVVAPEFDLEAWEREHSSILSGRSPFQS